MNTDPHRTPLLFLLVWMLASSCTLLNSGLFAATFLSPFVLYQLVP